MPSVCKDKQHARKLNRSSNMLQTQTYALHDAQQAWRSLLHCRRTAHQHHGEHHDGSHGLRQLGLHHRRANQQAQALRHLCEDVCAR